MNYGGVLASMMRQLEREASGFLKQNQIQAAEDTIKVCSAIAAVSGVATGWIPGAGGVIALGVMTATVWGMYVKINKDLGISIKENFLKFIASAFVTNMAANIGSIVLALALSAALSFIPGIGSLASVAIVGIMGYVVVYASAVLYIMLLTRIFKAKGSVDDIASQEELKSYIDQVNKEADLSEIVKEGKQAYKQAKKDGDLDKAKKEKEEQDAKAKS